MLVFLFSCCLYAEANTLARLTIAIFLEYVFHVEWKPEFEIFVEASWEWRKQIAGQTNPTKDITITIVVI